jgi:hypothetical protein
MELPRGTAGVPRAGLDHAWQKAHLSHTLVGYPGLPEMKFEDAAASFAKAQPVAPDPNELAGSTDWLWMSLSRSGRTADAKAVLDRRSPTLPPDYGYTRRLELYAGAVTPDNPLTPADTDDVQIATLSFGAGNWFLVQGGKAHARTWFERATQSDGWPAFGFILAEAELRRLN